MTDIIKSDTWDIHNPDWKLEWQKHFDAAQALLTSGDESEETEQLIKQHERGFKDAWVTQFKNAPEYARYMIGQFKSSSLNKGAVWLDIEKDIDAAKTVEDANKLYSDTVEFVERQKREQRNSLPVDQNSGLFNESKSRSFHVSFPRTGGSYSTDTILTIEEKEDQANICLTHLKDNKGMSVVNAVESLATILYQTKLGQTHSHPSKINWYLHNPAGETSLPESFVKVEMDFDKGVFKNPDFNHLKEVPKAIKEARFNAADSEITLLPAKQEGQKLKNSPTLADKIRKLLD